VTAIASDPQRNLDFYTIVLGLRFVKKTVNFDDPGTYHFYFGDDAGTPGTILTFFPGRMRDAAALERVKSPTPHSVFLPPRFHTGSSGLPHRTSRSNAGKNAWAKPCSRSAIRMA
jgi:catechol 2,3-dioxygenase-like lactoylglutathione lyase family enzyme